MGSSLDHNHGWQREKVGFLETRSTEGPSTLQWQAVKEEIRVLYEKRPLKDVKKTLEQRYGFRATYAGPPPPPPPPPPPHPTPTPPPPRPSGARQLINH